MSRLMGLSLKSGKRRRHAVPLWRSRWALGVVVALVLGSSAGGGWLMWHSGAVSNAADQLKWKLIALSADAGLRVREILVVGRRQTQRDALLGATRLAENAPILAFDPETARRRIEALPWVRSAVVERKLPGTVLLHLDERRPLALWQHRGRFSLIDEEGKAIEERDLERFSDLVLVVGEDASAHAAALLRMLETQPDLKALVRAAVRVGGRRWNLRLENGVDVQLPEENVASAWARLASYEHIHHVLGRDVKVLDLRFPDRLIVRKTRPPGNPKPPPGRET
ncbi:MAG: cell division protein FtsQ/DivIB [Rhodospirillales bacterium]|jgi:cell division protein FtsQ|nr:cell division protein FtsQ/DivIB [Rhodospirillales bacterium]